MVEGQPSLRSVDSESQGRAIEPRNLSSRQEPSSFECRGPRRGAVMAWRPRSYRGLRTGHIEAPDSVLSSTQHARSLRGSARTSKTSAPSSRSKARRLVFFPSPNGPGTSSARTKDALPRPPRSREAVRAFSRGWRMFPPPTQRPHPGTRSAPPSPARPSSTAFIRRCSCSAPGVPRLSSGSSSTRERGGTPASGSSPNRCPRSTRRVPTSSLGRWRAGPQERARVLMEARSLTDRWRHRLFHILETTDSGKALKEAAL